MGSSALIFRGHETQAPADAYSPKPLKPWSSVARPIRYLLREQRLVFVLVGIAIATLGFTLLPGSRNTQYANVNGNGYVAIPERFAEHDVAHYSQRPSFQFKSWNSGGKIPLGLKRKGLRIVVTGGAGFVGSHLVDRLIERGDSVIVVDNFFTGRKENVMHHFGNPRFELIRHDVVEPLLLEVDQIYHLACPASPVHYKFNPVKTIISFLKICFFFSSIIFFFIIRALWLSKLVFGLWGVLNRWFAGDAQDQCGGNTEHAGASQEGRSTISANQHQ